MNLQDIKDKLDDYANGKLSPAEKTALYHALDTLTEAERLELFPVDDYLGKGRYSLPEQEVNAALSRVKKTTVLIPWRQLSRYAAILVLAVGSLFLLRRNSPFYNGDKKIAKQSRSMRVPDGKQGVLVLSDGTRITINGGSELLFPEKFEGDRTVYLKEGEAYFEIAKDVQHPFTVKTSQLKVRVLGTSFSVRDYSDEKQAFVSVNSGKVALDSTLELIAGNGSILDKHTGTFTKQHIDTASTTAWTRGELIFQDAALQQVLQVLQHKYAVHFELKDSLLLKHRFTATFRNNSIQTIMQQLQLMSNIHYTITKNQIVIQ